MLLRSRNQGNFWLCVWGRLVRDATGEFLPFSQVGGYVLGARVITLHGVNAADAAASTLADITTEFLAQLMFIGVGLAVTAHLAPHSKLLLPVAIGLCIAVVNGVGLVLVQRGGGKTVPQPGHENRRQGGQWRCFANGAAAGFAGRGI